PSAQPSLDGQPSARPSPDVLPSAPSLPAGSPLAWTAAGRQHPAVPARSVAPAEADWRRSWRDAVRDPSELLQLLQLPELAGRLARGAGAAFPLRVPRGFVARMR